MQTLFLSLYAGNFFYYYRKLFKSLKAGQTCQSLKAGQTSQSLSLKAGQTYQALSLYY